MGISANGLRLGEGTRWPAEAGPTSGETCMEPIINIQGLCKSFHGKSAVFRLNLTVPEGAIFALLGDNGAGKTTTIRMLTGLMPPDAGQASILGQDCWTEAAELRHRVGYVPERPKYYDWMTVREIGW